MKTILCILIAIVILSGCITENQKDCKTDKECLKAAFAKCENAHGVWEGQEGNVNVTITVTTSSSDIMANALLFILLIFLLPKNH